MLAEGNGLPDSVKCGTMPLMGKHDKTLAMMRNNPRDWRIEQLEAVALQAGLTVRKPGGSHVIFQRDDCPFALSVPARKPIKPIYVTQFLTLIDWRPE